MEIALTEEVPKWFYIALASGSFSILVILVGIVFKLMLQQVKNNKEDWSEVKALVTDMVSGMKLHDHRLKEVEKDIEQLQIVRYNKGNGRTN